jgi:hypothetical protein
LNQHFFKKLFIIDEKLDAKSSTVPITVPKKRWRSKTTSLWKEEGMQHDLDFTYIYRDKNEFCLQKKKEYLPPPANPDFHCTYNDLKNRNELARNLMIEEGTSIDTKNRIISFIKEFWDFFQEAER